MIIAETLLPKLSEWKPAGAGRQSWSQPLDDTGWALHLTADRVDSLGCLVWEMILSRSNPQPIGNADLKAKAIAIADRVTGLMEPIKFLELDETRGEVLLRSETPTSRSTSLAYYEVLMRSNRQILVRRYSLNRDHRRREQSAFALTHEAIAKLVDDLIRE